MLFATFDYFLFLPLVVGLHWAVRGRGARVVVLAAASLLFYTAWNPTDTVILLAVISAAFAAGIVVHRADEAHRSALVGIAALVLLAPMGFYKYVPFVTENLHAAWPAFPVVAKDHLPIGISFYSFQALAYVIDVRRGAPVETRPLRFATFLLFFPHLVAGPILRSSSLLKQLDEDRVITREDVGYGVSRLVSGLVKKVLVADVLRIGVVDSVFTDPGRFTGVEVMVALYAYSLQIYCDFSGYTDFAIGSARLFGFRIPENFQRPYQALSVANYWRRWHTTLSDWVRDYVYYPMGGSRGGGWKPYRNTFVTLFILGVWHGANWTFVVYGLLHGMAVSLNRWWKRSGRSVEDPRGWSLAWRWLLTFHFVVLARILFRAPSLDQAWAVTQSLFQGALVLPRWSLHAWVVLLLGFAAHFTPPGWTDRYRERFAALPAPLQGVVLLAAAWACVAWGPGDSLAFIYHDF